MAASKEEAQNIVQMKKKNKTNKHKCKTQDDGPFSSQDQGELNFITII